MNFKTEFLPHFHSLVLAISVRVGNVRQKFMLRVDLFSNSPVKKISRGGTGVSAMLTFIIYKKHFTKYEFFH